MIHNFSRISAVPLLGWLRRDRSLGRDYERKVQTSETLIEVAMIRLMPRRLARQVPPDLGWLLVSQYQHDRHDRESHTTEEIGADGYEAGDDSPEL